MGLLSRANVTGAGRSGKAPLEPILATIALRSGSPTICCGTKIRDIAKRGQAEERRALGILSGDSLTAKIGYVT
jgi:hypothetical protein